jgi:Protein of unknown function (DUF541)
MIRSLVMIAAILATGTAWAQQPGAMPISPGPPGAGASRGDTATVSARAIGMAPGAPSFRGRINVQRRGATREEAVAALDKVVEEIRSMGGIDTRSVKRDGRTVMEPPQMQPSTPANPLPAIPPRGQMVQAYMETATFEVEASTRKAIQDWAAKIPPQPVNNQTQVYPVQSLITERLTDDDPAWAQATRNGLLAAERDARNAAAAAGGELGRLVGMWTERQGYVVDGNAQVTVTAEYQINRPRR